MSYFTSKFFPKVVPQTGELWNRYQISRITGLSPSTVKRYMAKAGIYSDVLKPIGNRNNHNAAHYTQESFLKFMRWMSSETRDVR